MDALGIFLIVTICGIMTGPKTTGRWFADCRNAYDKRRKELS